MTSKDDGFEATEQQSGPVGDTLAASTAQPTSGEARGLETPRDTRYQLGAEVGRGGLGRVLKARDLVLERPVAVKELFSTDDGAQRRFVREALITARLQHPAIVPIYDAGRRDNRAPYYAMKLVSGRPLERAIVDAKTLATRLALVPTVLAVCDAVAFAHGQKIIHRDLKPANVLLGEFGETIVIDWGLAKDLAIDDRDAVEIGPYRDRPKDETVAGALMGTPAYMAPEQASGEVVDERADVYALGAMLYHVIAGIGPHEGTTLEQMLDGVISGAIKPIAEREPDVPRDLAAIVTKAMAVAPGNRYPSAKELAEDLRKFLAGQLVGAHRYSLGQRIRRWLARYRAVATVSTIALIVLIGFALFSVRRITSERDLAIAQANRAIITQARATLATDPTATLEVLKQLDARGPGWDEARTLANGALAMPRLERALDGMTDVNFELTPDEHHAVTFGIHGFWFVDLTTYATRIVPVQLADEHAGREITMCDDNRHGLAEAHDHELFSVDVIDATIRLVKDAEAQGERERCRSSKVGSWITPDGQFVVTADADGGLHRSDRAGHELGVLPAVPLPFHISDTQMSDNGEVVAEQAGGKVLYSDFTWHLRLVVHDGGIGGSLAVAPDGSHVWGAPYGNGGGNWSLVRRFKAQNDRHMPGGRLAISRDGKWLTGIDDGALIIDEVAAGTSVSIHDVVSARPLANDRVAVSGFDGLLRIYRLTPRAHRHQGRVWGLALSPNAEHLVLAHPKALERNNARTGGDVETVAVESDAAPLYTAINDAGDVAVAYYAHIFVWPHGATAVRELGVQAEPPDGLAILRDGTPVSWNDAEFKIWSTTPRAIENPVLHSDARLLIDDAGTRALIPCGQGRCILDIASGRIDPLAGSTGGVAAISGDGRRALTLSATDDYQLWDLATRTSRTIGKVTSVDSDVAALSRDGSIAVIGAVVRAQILDLTRGTSISMRGHRLDGPFAWSPDQRTLVDSTGTVIDVRSGETHPSPTGGIIDLAVRDDGVVFITLDGVLVTTEANRSGRIDLP